MTFPFSQLVFGSIATLITLYSQQFENADRGKFFEEISQNFGLPVVKEYDFIIVGGGSAGSIVASRLSTKYNVLLIEAGGDPLPMSYVPANWPYLFSNEKLAQQFISIEQKNSCFSYKDHKMTIAQSRGLGGGSAINAMVYNRGSPQDYDNWASITQDKSWSYKNLLKYFKMSEDFKVPHNDHYGFGGPNIITQGSSEHLNDLEKKWLQIWKKAGEEIGFKSYENANGPQKEGFVGFSESKNFGRRISTWDAFLKPAENRTKLTIHRYSVVEKVHFNEKNHAYGVFYKRHGIGQFAKSKKEIILSAGALNSPHLLMNSGVGPKDQLKRAKIPVIVDSPVGQYFQDHPIAIIRTLVKANEEIFPNPDEKIINEFINNGKGPLANLFHQTGQAFITSEKTKKEGKNWPDLQLLFAFNPKGIYNGSNHIILGSTLGRPYSYGNVQLDLDDPKKQLIINPNYLADPRDMERLIEGMTILVKLAESQEFSKIGITLDKRSIPECKNFKFGQKEYFKCLIEHNIETVWHPIGTCRMGLENDPIAVVDSKLKVKGVEGLRVVDNSIQPAITNSNTNAPAQLIGQKGADMIMNEWREYEKEDGKKLRKISKKSPHVEF